MPTALLLSPHLDDAAFSCGGTAALLADAGWEVVLCTLFTQSVAAPTGFALECQTSKGLSPDVDYMQLRRAEDAAAAVSLGCCVVDWRPLPEAPHRGYTSAAMLFQPPLASDDPAPIAAELRGVLDRYAPDLLLAPACYGRHVDHVQMVRALHGLGRTADAYWTDLPYAMRPNPVPPPEGLVDAGELLDIDISSVLENKLDACAAYASQLGFQFGGEAGLRKQMGERTLETFRLATPAADVLRQL